MCQILVSTVLCDPTSYYADFKLQLISQVHPWLSGTRKEHLAYLPHMLIDLSSYSFLIRAQTNDLPPYGIGVVNNTPNTHLISEISVTRRFIHSPFAAVPHGSQLASTTPHQMASVPPRTMFNHNLSIESPSAFRPPTFD